MNKVNFSQAVKAGALAAIVAVVINSILFFIFHQAGVISDTVFVEPNKPLTVMPVIISSTLPSILASIVFFFFEKFTKNGFRNFTILSIILGLLSLVSPFMVLKEAPIGYALALNLMHVVVIAAILFFINKAVSNKVSYSLSNN